jgi:hypothetical protein
MNRSAALLLALGVSAASAGDIEDCYNSESSETMELTGAEPEILRITDADLAALLVRLREHEEQALATTRTPGDSVLQADLARE